MPKLHFVHFVGLIGVVLILLVEACAQAGLPVDSTSEPSSTIQVTASPTQQASPAPSSTSLPTALPSETPQPQAGEASIGDPYAPELGNSGYDVQHYNLQLNLDPSRAVVDGVVTIQSTGTLPAIDRLSLDFSGFEIRALTVDDQDASFERAGGKLWIDLPEVVLEGDSFTIKISYAGEPLVEPSPYVPFLGHVGLFFPGSTIFTLSEPDGAHYWFPCNDHPRDKATFSFQLTVPSEMVGVANGSLQDTIQNPDGTRTYLWEDPYPTATYLAVVGVGNYDLLEFNSPDGIPVRNYIYPDLNTEFNSAAQITGEALDWMASQYGPYPFDNFGYMTSRLVGLASETQTMVVLPEISINEETLIHEMAHMWFGDWVSLNTWADMWLKEGPAIYTYLLWQTRDNPQDLDIFMADRTAKLLAHPDGYALENLPKSQLLGTDTYWKGAAVFHALRKEIGDEAFFDGLRTYLENYGGGNASYQDFKAVMESMSGSSLDEFFEQWVETP
jgi:aminopeptidase N